MVEAVDWQSVRNGNAWIVDFIRRAEVQRVVVAELAGSACWRLR